ncbi:MAG TPA: hypothetical protein PLS66_11225 [Tepiditoga sp.]|nr:hypothetical protein [Tepiditoga sp.]
MFERVKFFFENYYVKKEIFKKVESVGNIVVHENIFKYSYVNNKSIIDFLKQINEQIEYGNFFYADFSKKNYSESFFRYIAEITSYYGVFSLFYDKNHNFIRIYDNTLKKIKSTDEIKKRTENIYGINYSVIFDKEFSDPSLIFLCKLYNLKIIFTDSENEDKIKFFSNTSLCIVITENKIFYPDIFLESLDIKKNNGFFEIDLVKSNKIVKLYSVDKKEIYEKIKNEIG